MALFNRQKNSDVPAELQPYYDAPRSGPRGIIMWVVRLVALALVIAALITLGIWGWHKIDTNDKMAGVAVTEQAKKPSTNKSTATSSASGQNSVTPSDDSSNTRATTTPSTSSSATTPSSTSPTTTTSSDQSATNPSTLVNTGPGTTYAIAALTAVFGVVVYQIYLRLKQRSNA